jgi:hypothetical protein
MAPDATRPTLDLAHKKRNALQKIRPIELPAAFERRLHFFLGVLVERVQH